MGMSASSTIIWGIAYTDENLPPWSDGQRDSEDEEEPDNEDFEDRYARLNGLLIPEPYDPTTYRAYLDAKNILCDKSGCKVGTYCCDETTLYYVAITESCIYADWEGPTELKLEKFQVKPEWEPKLIEFCSLMGIPPPPKGEARWWIVCAWE